jgi:cell fate regulator YaaT (PSP1 superfamily)
VLDFDAGGLQLSCGDRVIAEIEEGSQLGTVVPRLRYKSAVCHCYPHRKVLRKAEDIDIRQEELNIRKEKEYFQLCKKKITEHNLPMKLVNVEILSDGSKIIFFFTAENRVDFRQLVKELATDLRTRIELRQIGARNEAQIVGGIGHCGRELCCASFLQKFCTVTIKMTKEQGLTLDPVKISGCCGRLMCCLAYEFDAYVEGKKYLPKVGKKVITPYGTGKIKQINIITQKILIELEDGRVTEMKAEDFNSDMLINN